MGTKRFMSLNLSCFIEPCSYHHPIVLSYATIDLVSTPSPMQTTHHPLIPLPIQTNHTPFISFFYRPLILCGNVGPQPYILKNPFDHAHVGPFPPSTILAPLVAHDQTSQPTPISSTYSQPPPKIFYPTYGRQCTSRRLIRHQHFYQTSN